jgi:hypothetical protein
MAKSLAPIAERKRSLFLKYLAETGKVVYSAQRAGYQNSTYLHEVRKKDDAFAEAWKLAVEAAADKLEEEAIRRATDGVLEPHWHKGNVVGYTTKYSDPLLMFMLRGLRPEKFRESVNVNANITGKVGVAVLPMTAVNVEDWENRSKEVHDGNMRDVTPEVIDG